MGQDEGIWITKDGRRIKITDMANDHLVNSISMLKRSIRQMRLGHELSGWSALNFFNGEMAQYAVETALLQEEQMDNEEWLECYTLYGELMKEVIKRNIVYMIGSPFFSYMDRYIGIRNSTMIQHGRCE